MILSKLCFFINMNISLVINIIATITNSTTEYNLKAFIYKKNDSNNISRDNGYVTIALNDIKPLIFSFTPTLEKAFDY